MPAYNRNKINSGILRYPLDAFEEDTDYLRINTVDYKSIGEISPEIDRRRIEFSELGDELDEKGITQGTLLSIPLNKNFDARGFVRNAKNRYGNKQPTDRKVKSKDGTIFLPIPSNIQDGNSVKYTEGELDALTAQVLGLALKTMEPKKDVNLGNVGEIISTFLKDATNLGLKPEVLSHFTRSLAAQAANIPFGGNLTASQLLARQSGNIVNPNMELLFDGVTIRSFKFSFKMTPRGKDEMEHVKSIIRHFKKSMTPSSSGDVYLSTPKVFELTYMKGNGPHPFLHKFKPCALTDCSVNYTGEANYATYQDGTPVSMVMDLGFKELEPIYNDDYESDQGKGGVGY
jgi:hypothetical protein